MKKTILLFTMLMSTFTFGMAQTFYDGFTGTGNIGGTGDLTSNNGWTTHNPATGGGTIPITTGSLSLTGFQPSVGNKVSLPGSNATTSRDVNAALSLGSGITVAYFSALINVIDNTQLATTFSDNSYFMHFGKDAGTTNVTLFARLHIKKTASGLNYRLGIQNVSGTGASQTEATTDLVFGTTYLIVVKYDFNGASNDVATLWVAPTSWGGAEPAGGFSNSGSSSTSPTAYGSICIRNSSATPKADIDEVRSGLTWADVTPSGTIAAPTIQTSNITFSAVLQTQMNVSWTSGNGTRRVVKMNTSNNFSDPGNGVDSLGSSFYAGGQQIIYNGNSNTVPIVTGLTLGTTYWFKAWELNGTGANTMYCTTVGTNNPKSQTTAAAATPPVINLPTATTIKATSAMLGGHIAADGGAPILERGTVWRTTPGVGIGDNKGIAIGVDSGTFSMLRTGLPPKTQIYYAAYAINSVDTSLTSEASFTTLLGEPTNHVTNFTATAPTYSSIVNTWLDNNGTQPATRFLVLANTTGIFTTPTDTIPEPDTTDFNLADGYGAQTIARGVQTCHWNNLNSSTHYYFAIYPYTNSGNNIDYKTVPAAPMADVITSVFIPPVAAWTFDATPAAPNTPTSVVANFGDQAGTATLYADSTNGSSSWIQATELASFSGTTTNDPREGAAIMEGFTYTALPGSGLTANGKSWVIKFSMSALQDPILTFATRGTTTGFNTHQWAWSTDGSTFTNFGTNTAVNTSTFLVKTLDMTAINQLDGAPVVYLKITFAGGSNATGNNRLDNIVIRASAASTLPPTVATTAATSVAATSATLNGTVNANNQSTSVTFEYGTAPSTYGLPVAGVPATVSGGITTAITADLTGLAQNTTYYYRINGTNVNGPSNGNELTFTTGCLFPEPAGAISGPVVVCANNTGYQYSVPAIPNATSYIWTFPSGTELMNQGSDTVTAFFGITSGEISVIGTNDCGDEGEPSYFSVTVTVPLQVSLSIAASANNVPSGTTVTFTATPTNGGATPAYQWQVNNLDVTGATNVTYSYIPVNDDVVTCVLTSSESCAVYSPATSNQITMIVTGTPANLVVTGTVSAGPAVCYGALYTITVAGGNTTFEVLAGGSVTMVAGEKILYLPGTKVYPGGYMLGYIDPDGPFCPPAKSSEVLAGKEENGLSMMNNTFKIYPNPTSGIFTIEQLGETITSQVQVEVMGALGAKVLSADLQGSRKQELSIKGNPPGIYFVKVMAGEKVQIVKIILTN